MPLSGKDEQAPSIDDDAVVVPLYDGVQAIVVH